MWVRFGFTDHWHALPHAGATTLCGWMAKVPVTKTHTAPSNEQKCKRCLELLQLTLWRSDRTR